MSFIEPTGFPARFNNRPDAPSCGYINITPPNNNDPAAERIVDCFNQAVTNDEPTEAVIRTISEFVRTSRWFTHTGDGRAEMNTLTIDLADRRIAEWSTSICTSLTLPTTGVADLTACN